MDSKKINKDFKLRLIFSLFFLFDIVISQDSLFWFDMSKVRDKMPNTPMVIDNVFGKSQLSMLDSAMNSINSTVDGYRIQLFESSQVSEADTILRKYDKILSDSLYIVFDAPLYKIRYGDFINKEKAENAKILLKKKGIKKMWIVKSRINQKKLDNNIKE